MITTASNKGHPLSTVTVDKDRASKDQPLSRQVPPVSREKSEQGSRRLIKPSSPFNDFVTLKKI